jgi:predicted CoA-binding protein
MADKSVAEKLQFKPGRKILLVNPPNEVEALLGTLPDGVSLLKEAQAPVDIIVAFIRNRQELEAQLASLRGLLTPQGMLWVVYYKGSARVKTDIHRDSINAYAQTLGLTGVAMISVDQDWSALRLKVV